MTISTTKTVKTIAFPLTDKSLDQVQTIYSGDRPEIGKEITPGHFIIGANYFIKNLKVFSSIKSLPTAPFPVFEPEDNEIVKLQKALNIEWTNPRKQLDIFIEDGINKASLLSFWHPIGSISLLNTSGYPFRVYNLMDVFTDTLALELGVNAKIGVAIKDVGFGLLQARDTVTIHGSCVEELIIQNPPTSPPIVNVYLSGGSPVIANPIPPGSVEITLDSTLINNANLIDNKFLVTN